MSIIKNFIERFKQRREQERELENDVFTKKRIEEKQLSSDERELNDYLEEERARKIKIKLKQFRNKRKKEWWVGKPILKEKNQFLNCRNIFKGENTILKD